MHIIVTRGQPQADRWVRFFNHVGHQAVAWPLVQVHPVSDTAALLQAWRHWGDYFAVMFVSPHAVHYFFASAPPGMPVNSAQLAINQRAWATGPGTCSALLSHGVAPDRVDAPDPNGTQFDSEALWHKIADTVRPGCKVLIVRGDSTGDTRAAGSGRDWLAQHLQSAGALVDFVVAYQRSAPLYGATDLAWASRATYEGGVWVFCSTQAVAHLHRLLPQQDWSQARAVATHLRIAEAALQIGFGQVLVSPPNLAAVLASLESSA